MKTVNVKVQNLNYDHYESEKYDADIRRVIPGYEELHREIEKTVISYNKKKQIEKIAELGIGTGLTSERILKIVPKAFLAAVDFSKKMLSGARKRLLQYKTKFIFGDFSEINFGNEFDVVVAVIGIHHQNTRGKKIVFKKIFDSLKKGGVFVFGDLVTYRTEEEAAFNDAKHYAFMVANMTDEKSLKEWAYHHKFLNDLAPLEDQVEWLKEIGFKKVEVKFKHLNTALIVATR